MNNKMTTEYMSNEEVIEVLKGIVFNSFDRTTRKERQALDLAIKVLEEKQGKWIPVSERLPDKNMPCLVSVGKLNLIQMAIYSDLMETIDHKIFYQGDYGKNNFQNITEYVNAWQPLPEPYKNGGAE